MIDKSNVHNLLKVNGLDESSSLEAVDAVLEVLKYTDDEKQEVFGMLMSEGWFKNIASAPNPALRVTPPQILSSSNSNFVAPPILPSSALNTQVPMQSSGGFSKLLLGIIVVLILIAVGGGLAYAYVEKIGPFKGVTLSEENFLTSISTKLLDIKSSKYSLTGRLNVGPRDADAVPYITGDPAEEAKLDEMYSNDLQRSRDVSAILSLLGNNSYDYSQSTKKTSKKYPASLKSASQNVKKGYYGYDTSFFDPKTGEAYLYEQVDGGNDFKLTVTFETDSAVNVVKTYRRYTPNYNQGIESPNNPTSVGTKVSGKSATFNKDSQPYIYMSSKRPKPAFVEFSDSLKMLPADIDLMGSITASTEIIKDELPNWVFNVNAEGSLGDLSYKVNVDALKKDKEYFFKINNIPSFFLTGDMGSIKGKWVNVTSKVSTTSSNIYSRSQITEVSQSIPEVEKEYKENKEKTIKLMKRLIEIADQEKLIKFKNKPESEKVGDRRLTRYDLSINKSALIPFYEKLVAEVNTNPDLASYKGASADVALLEYLKSKEFDEIFTYIDKNLSTSMWLDSDGYVAKIRYYIRVIPGDNVAQLKNKQLNLEFVTDITDINKQIQIDVPSDALSIDKILEDYEKITDPSRTAGKDASIKSNLSTLRAHAEILFDASEGSYGKKAFTFGPCSNLAGTMFADTNVYSTLLKATNSDLSKATCVSKAVSGKVTSYAVSVPLASDPRKSWCVDSTGSSRQITGELISGSVSCDETDLKTRI